jgi:transposase-like protein
MKGKRRTTEEKIRILRQADGERTILEVCVENNISEQTFTVGRRSLACWM